MLFDVVVLLFWLLVGHALCDFPLQGNYLSAAKRAGAASMHWGWALTWHSMIHAGAVALVTGSVALGILELVSHWSIDFGKTRGKFSDSFDQALHVACKFAWLVVMA